MTSLYQQSPKDMMKPGIFGFAQYVLSVSAYRRGDYETAMKYYKAAMNSEYKSESDLQAIADLPQKAEAARLAKIKAEDDAAFNDYIAKHPVPSTERYAFLKNYDSSWWKQPLNKGFIESHLGPLGNLTGSLWLFHIKNPSGDTIDQYVYIVPRHMKLRGPSGTLYPDVIALCTIFESDIDSPLEGGVAAGARKGDFGFFYWLEADSPRDDSKAVMLSDVFNTYGYWPYADVANNATWEDDTPPPKLSSAYQPEYAVKATSDPSYYEIKGYQYNRDPSAEEDFIYFHGFLKRVRYL